MDKREKSGGGGGVGAYLSRCLTLYVAYTHSEAPKNKGRSLESRYTCYVLDFNTLRRVYDFVVWVLNQTSNV